MGWTGQYTDRPSKDIVIEALTQTHSEKFGSCRVLDIAKKGNTFYCAWERVQPDGKKYVLCMVMLTSRKDGEVCYKEVDECMGPCEAECPIRILDKLSPVADFAEPGTSSYAYAVAWRDRCRARANKPKGQTVLDGDTIKLANPLKFNNGATLDTFTIRKNGRKVRFLGSDGVLYRITGWQQRAYSVSRAAQPE